MDEIEQEAEQGLADAMGEVAAAAGELASEAVQPVSFGPLDEGAAHDGDRSNLDLLLDVQIPISVEVGRTQMSLEDVVSLVPGSVVSLDKKVEEPVDLRVNGKLVARGEVVLVDDTYGLRITQILDPGKRLESLR